MTPEEKQQEMAGIMREQDSRLASLVRHLFSSRIEEKEINLIRELIAAQDAARVVLLETLL